MDSFKWSEKLIILSIFWAMPSNEQNDPNLCTCKFSEIKNKMDYADHWVE